MRTAPTYARPLRQSSSGSSARTRSCSGPGLGRHAGSLELARRLAAEAPVPLLLDADGLNAHAGRLESLAGRDAPTVLTPARR